MIGSAAWPDAPECPHAQKAFIIKQGEGSMAVAENRPSIAD
jgi:hypothetical protein